MIEVRVERKGNRWAVRQYYSDDRVMLAGLHTAKYKAEEHAEELRAQRSRGRPPEGQRVAVRISDDVLARVDKVAEATERSRAAVIRSLIEIGLGAAVTS